MRLLARRSKSSRSRPCQNWSGPRTRVLQRVCASHGSCRRSTTTHPRLPDSSTRRPKAPRRLPVASPETPPSHRAPTRSACCDLLRRGIRHESCAEQNPPNRTMQGISPESSMSRGIKKYVVKLSEDERNQLNEMIRKGKSSARRLMKARILLKADVSEGGEGWSDSRIIKALETSVSMIYRVRKQLVDEGFEAVLSRKQRTTPAVARLAPNIWPSKIGS